MGYINFDGVSPMADLRRQNGQDTAWAVKYWGVGNENWGCGGNMTADFYADQFRRYATYCRDYGDARLMKIAGGANSTDYYWTETLMKNIPHRMMWGISIHYYTTNWFNKGPATGFSEQQYFEALDRCLRIPEVLDRHITIMDKYDPDKRVALVFDEWGTWWDVEEGTNPGFLFQQNTMRDAFVAALSLNEFNKRCDRIKMANIAQTINVLQALIFTRDEKMLLTPTYHVFEMYKVHQDATLLPLDLTGSDYEWNDKKLPALNACASKDKDGVIHISIVNIDMQKDITISAEIRGVVISEVAARILTSEKVTDFNSFEIPNIVAPKEFKGAKIKNGKLTATIPAKSVVVFEIK